MIYGHFRFLSFVFSFVSQKGNNCSRETGCNWHIQRIWRWDSNLLKEDVVVFQAFFRQGISHSCKICCWCARDASSTCKTKLIWQEACSATGIRNDMSQHQIKTEINSVMSRFLVQNLLHVVIETCEPEEKTVNPRDACNKLSLGWYVDIIFSCDLNKWFEALWQIEST